jgi:Mrp family chromosome partitioning ATPase
LIGTRADGGDDDAKCRTILVCSAQPDEGKTFAAVNLALSIAGEKDLEVVLVDADFANPQVPSLLGLKTGPGLTDALNSPGTDPNRFVIRTDVPGLSVLPAGRPANDVTELLASARTTEVVAALAGSDRRRILILDSPPVLVASPATVLAAYAGQLMMVVRADWTTDADLREALPLLSACENISLLLNRTRLSVSGRRFGSYYGLSE